MLTIYGVCLVFKGLGLKLEGLLELGTRVYRVDVAEDS